MSWFKASMGVLGVLILLVSFAATAMADCAPRPTADGDDIHYLLEIEPSDGVLDVWCKLQVLTGKFKVDVWFNDVNAHRSFETTFDGTPHQDRKVMADFIQSLLPMDVGSLTKDSEGQEFPKVLKNVVQAVSPNTPDGQSIGLPPEYPMSTAVALWEPMTIRMKPLNIADADFVLLVKFKPTVGRFLASLRETMEPFVIKGAKERVMPGVAKETKNCPQFVPNCQVFANSDDPTMDLQTAWDVTDVMIDSGPGGGRLSPTAMALFASLVRKNPNLVTENNMDKFSVTEGEARLTISDDAREILARAKGDQNHALGTQQIRVIWHDKPGPNSYRTRLEGWVKDARDKLVLQYSTSEYRKRPQQPQQ